MGDRDSNLALAQRYLSENSVEILSSSSIYESEAWGKQDQQSFLNQAVIVKSKLAPKELLHTLLAIEKKIGRVRKEKWGERIIDIDILFIEDQVINEPELVVPHPYIQERRFALLPLVELASNELHPVDQKSMDSLLDACEDELAVKKLNHL